MWIKSKDGRLHDAHGCSIEPAELKIVLVPRSGKAIVLADVLTIEQRDNLLRQLENSIVAGRTLIQL